MVKKMILLISLAFILFGCAKDELSHDVYIMVSGSSPIHADININGTQSQGIFSISETLLINASTGDLVKISAYSPTDSRVKVWSEIKTYYDNISIKHETIFTIE